MSSKSNSGVEALIKASKKGDVDRVLTLKAEGLNINGVGVEGFTPLYWATLYCHTYVIKVLLSAGANYKLLSEDDW